MIVFSSEAYIESAPPPAHEIPRYFEEYKIKHSQKLFAVTLHAEQIDVAALLLNKTGKSV